MSPIVAFFRNAVVFLSGEQALGSRGASLDCADLLRFHSGCGLRFGIDGNSSADTGFGDSSIAAEADPEFNRDT